MRLHASCRIFLGLFFLVQLSETREKTPEKLALFMQKNVEHLIEKILSQVQEYYHEIKSAARCIPDYIPDVIMNTLKESIDCVSENEKRYALGLIKGKAHIRNFLNCFTKAKKEVNQAIQAIDPEQDYCPQKMTEKTYRINMTTTFVKTFQISISNGLEVTHKKIDFSKSNCLEKSDELVDEISSQEDANFQGDVENQYIPDRGDVGVFQTNYSMFDPAEIQEGGFNSIAFQNNTFNSAEIQEGGFNSIAFQNNTFDPAIIQESGLNFIAIQNNTVNPAIIQESGLNFIAIQNNTVNPAIIQESGLNFIAIQNSTVNSAEIQESTFLYSSAEALNVTHSYGGAEDQNISSTSESSDIHHDDNFNKSFNANHIYNDFYVFDDLSADENIDEISPKEEFSDEDSFESDELEINEEKQNENSQKDQGDHEGDIAEFPSAVFIVDEIQTGPKNGTETDEESIFSDQLEEQDEEKKAPNAGSANSTSDIHSEFRKSRGDDFYDRKGVKVTKKNFKELDERQNSRRNERVVEKTSTKFVDDDSLINY